METWYVLETGEVGDPRDVAPDSSGVLRHKDGRAVAYSQYGPRSSSVDAAAERAKSAANARKAPVPPPAAPSAVAKDMNPAENKAGYVTRQAEAKK